MTDRTTRVRLEANVQRYIAEMAKAKAATGQLAKEVRGLAGPVEGLAQDLQPLGTAGLAVGSAFLAGGVLAGKAAISWESAFAGVRKTVDGTESELSDLSDELRRLARDELPASREEIAGVAEAAGQLGVATSNVDEFTEVMVNLGETTNLQSTEAAMSLARLAAVTKMPQSEYDRLGSTVVELGNNFETTEADIVAMGQRLAAAGSIIGLTEAEILGMAAALSSVGVEAEAGGTAFSKVFIELASAVDEGGAQLDKLAAVAGMSGEAMAVAFQDDAAGAIISFVEGLGTLEARGQSVFAVLENLGLTEARMRNALLSAAQAGGKLSDAVDTGSRAWEENIALTEEAKKRYETVEKQVELFWNTFTDLAVDAGAYALPVMRQVINAADLMVDGFREAPGPLKITAGALGGVTGSVTVLGGSFLFLLPRLRETKHAWDALSDAAPRFAKGMRIAGTTVAVAGGLLALGTVAHGFYARAKEESRIRTDEFVQALREETQGLEGSVDALLARRIVERDLDELAVDAGISIDTVTAALRGEKAALDEVNAAAEESQRHRVDGGAAALALAQRVGEEAAAYTAAEAEAARLTGQEERLGVETDTVTGAVEGQTGAFEDGTDAADEFAKALDALFTSEFGVEEALDRVDQALIDFADDVATAKVEGDKFATSLDNTTTTGLNNREMLRGLVDDVLGVAEAMTSQVDANGDAVHSGAEVSAMIAAQRERLIEVAIQLGFTRDEAGRYIDVLLQVPGSVNTVVTADTGPAIAALQSYATWANRVLNTIGTPTRGTRFAVIGGAVQDRLDSLTA